MVQTHSFQMDTGEFEPEAEKELDGSAGSIAKGNYRVLMVCLVLQGLNVGSSSVQVLTIVNFHDRIVGLEMYWRYGLYKQDI